MIRVRFGELGDRTAAREICASSSGSRRSELTQAWGKVSYIVALRLHCLRLLSFTRAKFSTRPLLGASKAAFQRPS